MASSLTITDRQKTGAVPITALSKKEFAGWQKKQPAATRNWLAVNRFTGESGQFCLIPNKEGTLERVVCGVSDTPDTWSLAGLAVALPPETYTLETKVNNVVVTEWTLGWALAGYKFTRYKSPPPSSSPRKRGEKATLVAPTGCDVKYVRAMAEAIHWARDLINTPAGDMHPAALAKEAADFGRKHGGKVSVIKGDALLKANYPTIHAVGKAAEIPAHLVDIRFPRKGAKKVTLVGKGITFDTGGLDIKPTSAMRLMKKDMGGAANVLALASAIVTMKLPVELRVLLPIAENAVAGNAMRPLDIVKTRKGITVEIGNTDAEGRLVLCDALAEADSEKPDLIIDCATLTGAARVALGSDVPAFFTPDDKLADAVMKYSDRTHDPLWRLPLATQYRSFMDSKAADLSNDASTPYGGAITAALYLKEFVEHTQSWLHVDMMAWNLRALPGRPLGGEAMGVRALYALIKEHYAGKK